MMMVTIYGNVICVLLLVSHGYSSGVITSTTSLQHLMQREKYVIKQLQKAIEKIKKPESSSARDAIERYISSYKQLFENGKTEEQVSHHPVDAFHFLKLAILEFKQLQSSLANSQGYVKGVMEALSSYRKNKNYPDYQELERTGASLARMREVYRIPFKQLIQGTLVTKNKTVFQSSSKLNAMDCYIIGSGSVKLRCVNEGMMWLEEAERMRDRGDESADKEDIIFAYEGAKLMAETTYDYHYTKNEEALCRGEPIKESLKNANLVCRYLDRGNPYLLIGPMKLEEMSKDPPIMVFHGFAFDSELKRFKDYAMDKLKVSIVQHEKDGEAIVENAAFERTSATAWLHDANDFDLSYRISRRIDAAMNLDTGTLISNPYYSQPYQIVNYGIAGLYVTHTDYLEQVDTCEWVKNGGDRIVTIVIYLADVALGGATVFPDAGVSIPPERGAAAVWYNLYRSGKQDVRTKHSGCPVVYGSKWISNKWIMSHGQIMRQNCSLDQSEKYDLI